MNLTSQPIQEVCQRKMAGYDNADRPTMQIGGDGVGVTNSFDQVERLTGQVYWAGVSQWYGIYFQAKDGAGLAAGLTGYVGSLNYQSQGMIDGASDALFADGF